MPRQAAVGLLVVSLAAREGGSFLLYRTLGRLATAPAPWGTGLAAVDIALTLLVVAALATGPYSDPSPWLVMSVTVGLAICRARSARRLGVLWHVAGRLSGRGPRETRGPIERPMPWIKAIADAGVLLIVGVSIARLPRHLDWPEILVPFFVAFGMAAIALSGLAWLTTFAAHAGLAAQSAGLLRHAYGERDG